MKLCSSALLFAQVGIILTICGWVSCTEEQNNNNLNAQPIIGILAQEDHCPRRATSQTLENVEVKWLQTAGAQVVPILINQPNRYYHYLMDRINGVMFPGGDVSHLSSGYAKVADLILDIAIAKNDRGIHFPVWGVCQGFQKLVTYFAGNRNTNWITMCRTKGVDLNLDFTPGLDLYRETRMFANGREIVPILAKYPVTPNFHWYCLTTEDFNRNLNLSSSITLISSNTHNGTQFVSTIEHRKYPFYGTQWHPELPQFYGLFTNNSDTVYRAILVAQYLSNFFVNQTRKNNQHFRKETAEKYEWLIENFNSDHLDLNTYSLPL